MSATVDVQIAQLETDGIKAVGIVRAGNPVTIISELAEEIRASVLIVGNESIGMSGPHGPGYMAKRLVEDCPRPVLVVK